MTRDEINRRISELRDEWDRIEMTGGSNGSFDDRPIAKDWHADANWPTLLREMPVATLLIKNERKWAVYQWGGTLLQSAATDSEAVCLAWLKWKEAL